MTRIPGQGLPELKEAVRLAAAALPRVQPEFQLDIGWAKTYEELFADVLEKTAEHAVLERTLMKGRCILAGRGGGGKTQLLRRLVASASSQGVVAILVDLKDWTKPDYETWREWTESDMGAGASFLLERFSQPKVDVLALDYLPPTTRKLVIVDGLNEIIAPIGQQILRALDELAGDQVGLSVLVADRMTRRTLPSPSRWALATVMPLAEEVIVKHCGTDALMSPAADSLSSPYFLDAAIRHQAVTQSPSETHRRFLHDHGGLDDRALDNAAAAAFRLYEDASTRTFSVDTVATMTGEALYTQLVQTGVLHVISADSAQFAHHLIHDYLAARHVAGLLPDCWTRGLLKTISFDGSSFDTIAMVLAQLKDGHADVFVRCLYDWNPYAAAYALSENYGASNGPSFEIQQVIFAMLAEKTFDTIAPTKQQASDALAIVRAYPAVEIKAAKSLPGLLATMRRVTSETAWFNDWASIFTIAPDEHIGDDVVALLLDDDSVAGWTVANVARRTIVNDAQLARMRDWLADERSVVRWRIAHVLGKHPSDENARALAKLVEADAERDVRYGAVRSLAEMAALADENIRDRIVALLAECTPTLISQKKVKEELKRALCIEPTAAPPAWAKTVALISRTIYVAEDDPVEREGWRQYVDAALARYSPN